jgi:hypothetical protein
MHTARLCASPCSLLGIDNSTACYILPLYISARFGGILKKKIACSAGEQIVSGFGAISTSTVPFYPRTGQLVAQFVF